jgi:hypothetical protein
MFVSPVKWIVILAPLALVFGLSLGIERLFAPVRVNETLTLLSDQDTSFDSHRAFHVSDAEFDAVF